ncbi:M15 family metallopeptidase [Dactylosporangium fulvum]|uniref:D-alanyl-D-alanine dipeptidase n=1 Tax=Dactylosporangium fulvum TaxID=53359 RepID=A0ABY5WDA9_9ACTN|nr:M15 family metallopeptidase [Dactylosporangium fulvum]UWP87515.1 4Fe-4S binding protein [Dactylosporangium fulvum]
MPTGSLFRTEFGTVVVQEDICNGCGYCIPACPYGVIRAPGSIDLRTKPNNLGMHLVVRVLVAAAACALTASCGGPARSAPSARPPHSATGSSPAQTVSPSAAEPSPPAPASPSGASLAPVPPGFVALPDVDPSILTDIRYATAHNFVGRPVAGYRQPRCLLTRQAAEALHHVQTAALARGYSLKVYDCYRPQQGVDDFIRWAGDRDQRMKSEFYPEVDKSVLFDEGYIGGPTAHSRGSTVDLTLVATPPRDQPSYTPDRPLVACTAPAGQRFPDNSIDMGTGFDCFDPLAHTAAPGLSTAVRDNRALLTGLMATGGFANYPKEWWHYTLGGEPFPRTYFDFPVA